MISGGDIRAQLVVTRNKVCHEFMQATLKDGLDVTFHQRVARCGDRRMAGVALAVGGLANRASAIQGLDLRTQTLGLAPADPLTPWRASNGLRARFAR